VKGGGGGGRKDNLVEDKNYLPRSRHQKKTLGKGGGKLGNYQKTKRKKAKGKWQGARIFVDNASKTI